MPILPPGPALQRPASVRGDGRAAEEAEAEPALSRALHRQRHHGTATVHPLPAHLAGGGAREAAGWEGRGLAEGRGRRVGRGMMEGGLAEGPEGGARRWGGA